MRSERPKPLHRLCGRPMLMYVMDAVSGAGVDHAVVVVGHKAELVTKKLNEQRLDLRIDFVEQAIQRGTGDAVLVSLVAVPDESEDHDVLVLPGDSPLLRAGTLRNLIEQHRASGAAATMLTARMEDPTGYGRVIRNKAGTVARVVEQRDASEEELSVNEVNTSIYVFRRSLLAPALRRIEPDNAQGEYYLTDVIEVLAGAGHKVDSLVVIDAEEVQGINDRVQLAGAEVELRRRTNEALLRSGVTMVDPDAVYIDTTVQIGGDVTLFPGVILQGSTIIGSGTEVGPNVHLIDTVIGENCVVRSTSGESAVVGSGSTVGPFASLPPGSEVPSDCVTGSFYTAEVSG
ncbi:MAG: NTP transferase domain-containing protein [Microthrixaceae bacterium]|nr:NTP transferase domain-containing protein [Microthrixaceae bacterium]